MTMKSTRLNEKFKRLILNIEGNIIKRKELINYALKVYSLNSSQAEGFVARNIYRLTRYGVVVSKGRKGNKFYVFDKKFIDDLKSNENHVNKKDPLFKYFPPREELVREEILAKRRLEVVTGELESYKEFLIRFPSDIVLIKSFIDVSEIELNYINGRLNALRKIMRSVA